MYAFALATSEVLSLDLSCFVDSGEIDRVNILEASLQAMTGAVRNLQESFPDMELEYLLIDGTFVPRGVSIDCKSIIKGDSSSFTIAAASIIAKV